MSNDFPDIEVGEEDLDLGLRVVERTHWGLSTTYRFEGIGNPRQVELKFTVPSEIDLDLREGDEVVLTLSKVGQEEEEEPEDIFPAPGALEDPGLEALFTHTRERLMRYIYGQ